MIFAIDESTVNSISSLIQLSVAPVFLIAGVGAILGVFSQRLARIIDRVERINTELLLAAQHKHNTGNAVDNSLSTTRDSVLKQQRHYLEIRAKNMNFAIFFCTMTGFLVASVIMILFLSSFFAFEGGLLIAGLFIAGMAAFMLALTLFLREVYMATLFMKMRR